MPKISEGTVAIGGLILLAVWLLVGLPIYLSFDASTFWTEPLGVKRGEWLLFLATMGLWYATWRLVKGAEKTAASQLRPYVFVAGCEVVLWNQDAIQARIYLKNFGSTPGYNFRTWTNIRIGMPGEEVFGASSPWKQDSIIAPGADLNAPSDHLAITQQDVADVIAGNKTIYVWGEVVYTDAFEQSWKFAFLDTAAGKLNVVNAGGVVLNVWGLSPKGYIETQEQTK